MPGAVAVGALHSARHSQTPLITLRDVKKAFGGKVILDRVSFEVHGGECLMLVGENGAGKSTLKNLMCGLLKPDGGSIAVDGRPVTIEGQRRARELGIATIHQELSLFPNLTVAENIFLSHMSSYPSRVPWQDWVRRAGRILRDQLDSTIDPRTLVGELSVGQRQLVEIAKALALDARILILDEPTTCLSLPERDRLMGLVRRLLEKGLAIIYITHFMDEVYALADRIVVLRDGVLVGDGSPEQIPRTELGRLMAGRLIAETVGELPSPPRAALEKLSVRCLCDGNLVRDVSFSVRSGEILGLAGLVGSGRSEVAELIVGLRKCVSGHVLIGGKEQMPRSPREALKLGIALISEDRRRDQAFLGRPVLENMTAPFLKSMCGRFGFLSPSREMQTARRLKRAYHINFSDHASPMSSLSGGNQQKIIIGRWLETQPAICILDEPTKGIDIGAREVVHRLIVELALKGMAIVLISSDLPELMSLSHRIVVLHKGRSVGEADPQSVSIAELIQMASSGKAVGNSRTSQ